MKYIIAVLILVLSLQQGNAQKKLSLVDFTVKENQIKKRNASSYLLTLIDPSGNINIRVFSKPNKIVDSYFDDKYLVLVFRDDKGLSYLTGLYKDEESDVWVADYFYRELDDLSSGLRAEIVTDASFLNGETLILTYSIRASGQKDKIIKRILRIGKDRIWTYETKDKPPTFNIGNNPIRPID